MSTITIEVPNKYKIEYEQVFVNLIKRYHISKLKEISEKEFYIDMLDWIFSEDPDFKVLEKKNGKFDFSTLLK